MKNHASSSTLLEVIVHTYGYVFFKSTLNVGNRQTKTSMRVKCQTYF